MQRISMICLCVLLTAMPVFSQATSLAEDPEVASSLRLLEAWIETQMAYRGLPGLSIGIVRGQELIWCRGFGFADLEKRIPATPQTNYRIASISKLFTATAILQLRDVGKLQLDDPVAKHLPWFKIRNNHPDAPDITIRHLLTHTSGLPRESPFPYWMDANFPTREEIIESLPKQQTIYAPETQLKYSNLALALAGEIVQAVSGQPYAGYIQQHILGPLDMANTSVLVREDRRKRLATPYGRRLPDMSRPDRPFMDTKGITPAAGLSSNVKDLARFASLQFRDGPAGGKQILKGSTLREMHRVHWLAPGWERGRGLGFSVWKRGSQTLFGHGGSLAGYRTILQMDGKEKIAVIVMTNAGDGNPGRYASKAWEWIAPALKHAAASSKELPQPDPAWQRYVGRYRNPWGDSHVLIYKGELVIINPAAEDPLTSMMKLMPVAEHTFRIEGKVLYQDLGELVIFELGPDGKVVRMREGANYSDPIP
jgi:CubicO group peptidase (beta-lactamase class C family)